MAKGFAPHRVVTRNADDQIISDKHFESFAQAEPIWLERQSTLHPGFSVALQHGARVIKWWPPSDD